MGHKGKMGFASSIHPISPISLFPLFPISLFPYFPISLFPHQPISLSLPAMSISENHNILITGACGFVGQQLIIHLLENTSAVLLICCREKNKFPKPNKRLVFLEADLLRPNSFGSIFQQFKPRHVIHLAALARFRQGEENPELAVQTNFYGSRFLIDLAIKHEVESFLFLSSNLAREPKSVVGITKLLTENYIQQQNSTTTRLMSLRLPNVPDSPGSVTLIFKKQIDNNEDITITHHEMSRVFVSCEEAAKYILFLLEDGKDKETFIVSKSAQRITDLAQQMIKESGKSIAIKYIGMQPGEKLEEEPYKAEDLKKTGISGLSLFSKNGKNQEEVENSISILQKKIANSEAGMKTIKLIEVSN